jgi:hypothetical protein
LNIAPVKQRTDKRHLLFHGSKVENVRSVQGRGHQLLRRVGLAVALMELSGGMVEVRAGEQESIEC